MNGNLTPLGVEPNRNLLTFFLSGYTLNGESISANIVFVYVEFWLLEILVFVFIDMD